jgi:hypothetical protein
MRAAMNNFRIHPDDTQPEYHYWLGWFSDTADIDADVRAQLVEEMERADVRALIREMLNEPIVDLTTYRLIIEGGTNE